MDNEQLDSKAKIDEKTDEYSTCEGTKPRKAEGRIMQEKLSRTTQEQLSSLHVVNEYFELVFRSALQ